MARGKKLPLLAVGGSRDLQKLLARVLRKTHRLDFADTSIDALRRLAEKCYSAVLVIGPLPDGGEWQLLDAIRSLGGEPPVILLSTSIFLVREALSKGAAAALLLPFDVHELRSVIQTHEIPS